jgi:hypothetical protein
MFVLAISLTQQPFDAIARHRFFEITIRNPESHLRRVRHFRIGIHPLHTKRKLVKFLSETHERFKCFFAGEAFFFSEGVFHWKGKVTGDVWRVTGEKTLVTCHLSRVTFC